MMSGLRAPLHCDMTARLRPDIETPPYLQHRVVALLPPVDNRLNEPLWDLLRTWPHPPDFVKVHLGVSIQQSFYVLHIFVTMCNDLHDDEVFDSRQPDWPLTWDAARA
jgi:hypothetical protein